MTRADLEKDLAQAVAERDQALAVANAAAGVARYLQAKLAALDLASTHGPTPSEIDPARGAGNSRRPGG